MSGEAPLVERAVKGFDVEGFSAMNTRRQDGVQGALDAMFRAAAAAAGMDYAMIGVETTGDGALMVLPADVDLVALVARFVPELEIRLRAYNEDRVPETRIRLRVAMHSDAIRRSTYGYAGPALVFLSRLLDSRPVRQALKDHPSAHLAFIVSEPVFRKVCQSGLGGIRPEHYARVEVDIPAKNFCEPAYLYVPGHVPQELDRPDEGRPGEAGPGGGRSGGPRPRGGVSVEGNDNVVYQGDIRTHTFVGRDRYEGGTK